MDFISFAEGTLRPLPREFPFNSKDPRGTSSIEEEFDNVSGRMAQEQGFSGREESMCLEGTQGWRR
jgi:hypothetical protein